jgi:hypothetical protein
MIERCTACRGDGRVFAADRFKPGCDVTIPCRACGGGGGLVKPEQPTRITLPPGRGLETAIVPWAVARYVAELEGAIDGWRQNVERNRALRIEAEARAGRLAREARR